MIYIDSPTAKTKGRCHMVAHSITELHEFALRIGVKRCWFENKRGKNRPHYDITKEQSKRAIEAGAQLISSKELVRFLISLAKPLKFRILRPVEFDKNHEK